MQKAVNQIYWVKSWLHFKLGSFAKILIEPGFHYLHSMIGKKKEKGKKKIKYKEWREKMYLYSAYIYS